MTETPTGPDTGFKLFTLVKDVLTTSSETDTDQLALEVLERIPSYDRDTALYQALRQLVRTSFRPAFIPHAPKDATVGEAVPHQRKAENPPPERDGRQWMPSFVPPGAERAADIRASLEEGSRQIAAGNLGTPLADVMAELGDDEADAALDRVEAGVASAIEAGKDEQRVRRDAAAAAEDIARRRAASRRVPPPVAPRPKTSPKVAAIREAWRKSLMQRIAVGDGKHKFLGDCTVDDLVFAAEQREQHAKRTMDRAGELRRLVDLMREHDASKLSDLPAEVLAEAPLDGAA